MSKKFLERKSSQYLIFGMTCTSCVIQVALAMAYMYLTLSSPIGLALACLMALGNLFVFSTFIYNTSVSKNPAPIQQDEKALRKQNILSKLFLALAIPSLILAGASTFIGTYKSLLLLGAALSTTAAPAVIIGLGITIGLVSAIGFLFYCATQTMQVWERIKPHHAQNLVDAGVIQGTATNSTKHALGLLVVNALTTSATAPAVEAGAAVAALTTAEPVAVSTSRDEEADETRLNSGETSKTY